MHRALRWSWEGGRFLISEVPLYRVAVRLLPSVEHDQKCKLSLYGPASLQILASSLRPHTICSVQHILSARAALTTDSWAAPKHRKDCLLLSYWQMMKPVSGPGPSELTTNTKILCQTSCRAQARTALEAVSCDLRSVLLASVAPRIFRFDLRPGPSPR